MPTAIPSPNLGSESKSLLDDSAGSTTTGAAQSSEVNSHRPMQLKLELRQEPEVDATPATRYNLVQLESEDSLC